MSEKRLIVFAKSPRSPDVKSRLAPLLTPKEREQLQKALIQDTLSLITPLPIKRALACTPSREDPFFLRCQKKYDLLLFDQEGSNLGERMKNAFHWGFSQGAGQVILIGSDAPTLPAYLIQDGFDHLEKTAVVLGPATDGGYYLIGAKPPLPDIFRDMHWGTETVLSETIRRLPDFYLLDPWYDIDRPEDLIALKEQISKLRRDGKPIPEKTGKFLKIKK